MAQGILITAYKDEENLLRLVRHFDTPDFRVLVHIDKKSKELSVDRLQRLGQTNLEVVAKYRITWGSINHVKAVLQLIKMALRHDDVEYLHVVSGADIALHSPEWFVKRFKDCRESYFSDGVLPIVQHKDTRIFYERYYCPSTWNPRNKVVIWLNNVLFWVQQKFGVCRKRIGDVPVSRCKFGMIWASFCREAGVCLLDFAKCHPRFMHSLNLVRVPEEIFFVTALIDSKWAPKHDSTNLRFYEWTREQPAVLDETDYSKLQAGDYAFARKIDSKKSHKLIEMIKADIAEELARSA